MDILKLLDRPIAFQRAFVRLTGSINAALMLSQAVYWSTRTTLPDGWFYKTREEWEEETGLSRYEQEGARKILVAKGLFSEVRRGVPCKVHYQVNVEELAIQLGENQPTGRQGGSKPVGEKSTNKKGVCPPTITETTAESISDTSAETTHKAGGVVDLARVFAESYPTTTAGQETSDDRQKFFLRETQKLATKDRSQLQCAEFLVERLVAYRSSVYVRTIDPRFIPLARNWLMGKKYNESDEAWSLPARRTSTLPFADFNEERAQLARIVSA